MKTIFVVEDDRDIRESLIDVLESEGFPVANAENGKDALEKLKAMAQLPGLILLDIMMPIMDGYTFRKIQMSDSKLSSIPVVVTSAGPNAEVTLKDCKIDGFLKKPVDLEQILKAVRKFCA